MSGFGVDALTPANSEFWDGICAPGSSRPVWDSGSAARRRQGVGAEDRAARLRGWPTAH